MSSRQSGATRELWSLAIKKNSHTGFENDNRIIH